MFDWLQVLRIENAHKSPPPVNEVTSEYHLDLVSEPIRAGLKPLVVSQPEGPSFEVSLPKSRKRRGVTSVPANARLTR